MSHSQALGAAGGRGRTHEPLGFRPSDVALLVSDVSPGPGSSEILWAGSQVQSTAYPDGYPKELEKTMGPDMGTREDPGKKQAGR